MSKPRRSNDSAAPAALPFWRQRWAVIASAAVLLLVLLVFLSGRSWPIVFDRVLADGFFLLLWLLAAAGFGSIVPLPRNSLRRITQIALGLGILGFIQLLLGLIGVIHQWTALGVVAIGIVLLLWRARSLNVGTIRTWFGAEADWDWLWLLAVPVLAMALVAAFAPAGVLWGDEPHGYDVLEYHLQLPREWHELGRIIALKHNVFSYFPLGVEMHYLLAMQLRGGPWSGMYLAQLMHLSMVALSVVAVYATACLFADKPRAILAAIVTANIPWFALLAPVAYNEGGILLFGTLAIAWCLTSETASGWIIAGVCAGFACGVKLTAIPQILLLAPILALITLRAKLTHAAAFIIAGTLVVSPWLIRNTISARNPFFPEAQTLLGHAHFSPEQTQRWQQAHHPQATLAARLHGAVTQILLDHRYAWLLIPLALAGAILSFRRPQARFILALLIAWLLFWIAFTHLQSRFFVLAIPVAAIAIALLPRRIAFAGAIACVIIGLVVTGESFGEKVSPLAKAQVLGIESFKGATEDIDMALSTTDRPIVLIGDAKAFMYELPMNRLHYRTVFDVDVKPGESIVDAWARGAPESAQRIVSYPELERFAKTYYGIPPVTTQPAAR